MKYNNDILDMAGDFNHGSISTEIAVCISRGLRKHECVVSSEGWFYYFQDNNGEWRYYIPDLMVVCKNMPKHDNGVTGSSGFIVEVLSRSTSNKDKIEKKLVYEANKVKEYWLINKELMSIEVNILNESINKYEFYTILYAKGAHQTIALKCWPDVEIDLDDVFYGVDFL